VIHDFSYVLVEHHGNYVLNINMGIKQDRTPLEPSKLDEVGVLPPNETIHGNIPCSNTFVDENVTTDPIVNAIKSAKVVLHILQQGPRKGTLSFETSD
jgi:hypothetical protein